MNKILEILEKFILLKPSVPYENIFTWSLKMRFKAISSKASGDGTDHINIAFVRERCFGD